MLTAPDLTPAEWRREVLMGRTAKRTYDGATSALPPASARNGIPTSPLAVTNLASRYGRPVPRRIGPGLPLDASRREFEDIE